MFNWQFLIDNDRTAQATTADNANNIVMYKQLEMRDDYHLAAYRK